MPIPVDQRVIFANLRFSSLARGTINKIKRLVTILHALFA